MAPDARATGETAAQVRRLFEERLHLRIPSDTTDLFETAALDSMAFVELLAEMEQEFGIEVALDDIDMDAFRTIASIAAFVDARRPAAAPEEGPPRESASSGGRGRP